VQEMVDSKSGFSLTNTCSVFLNGNAKLFTEYLQKVCDK
jgi:hypothetical protein